MKKVKIVRFVPDSVYKTIIFASVIPWIIGFVIVFISTVVRTISTHNAGPAAKLITTLLPMFLWPILYGLIFLIFIASYNLMAPKFGGLEIEVEEIEKITEEDLNNEIK